MNKKLKVLYQIPSLNTLYAGRTIYNGYKNGFLKLGHQFRPLTADDNLEKVIDEYKPDIMMTSLSKFNLKYLDLDIYNKARKNGMVSMIFAPYWSYPFSDFRINEDKGLSDDKELIKKIKDGLMGDIFYHPADHEDPRMQGFEEGTGYKYHTVLLAADDSIVPQRDERFNSDILFLGTNLPEKRDFFKRNVLSYRNKYKVMLLGQDWTFFDRLTGWVQRGGQYFNIPILKNFKKPKYKLQDEANMYCTSKISVNVHEEYQRISGGCCNERTYKIPLYGGFEIVDNVRCIKDQFEVGKEIVFAENEDDWNQKMEYYLENPEKRIAIMKAGQERVRKSHTYTNRTNQLIELYKDFKKI